MSKRQGNMKERIQQVAIELFTEQGYDKTSLREIAERLEVSKAALYYHFNSKEEILQSIVESKIEAVEELLDWGESQPRSSEFWRDFFCRLSELISDQLQPLIRFALANRTVMKTINMGRDQEKAQSIASRIKKFMCDPDANPTNQLRTVFAMGVLFIGASPILNTLDLKANSSQIKKTALDVALELISSPPGGQQAESSTA